MGNYVIGLDQGTTGSFIALMNQAGEVVSNAYREHRHIQPRPGWVEQDPIELWQIARDLLNQLVEQSGIDVHEIAGMGIANQGESIVMWDRQTGEPLSNVLLWQDTRTTQEMEQLATDAHILKEIQQRTGLKPDAYFSASKIRWLLNHVPQVDVLIEQERLACGTLDSWLIWNLTAGQAFVTDVSTASRTLLFDIHAMQWDEWLLDLFNIPAAILPTVMESTGAFGQVSHPDLQCRNIAIVASIVDQPAAMIGHGCLHAGQIKATYGTGCFINLNTGAQPITSDHGLLTMLAWQREGQPAYGLDGGVFTAGASLNWLRDSVQLFAQAQDIDDLCSQVKDSDGVLWIPSQIGLGAPYWDRTLRGAWLGIGLGTSKAHLVRAVLEGICARVAQIVQSMITDAQLSIAALRVDGGLTQSEVMMQIQADLLGYPIEVLENQEATATGMCMLAARASNLWETDEVIEQQVHIRKTYEPRITEDARREFLNNFDEAVRCLTQWKHDERA